MILVAIQRCFVYLAGGGQIAVRMMGYTDHSPGGRAGFDIAVRVCRIEHGIRFAERIVVSSGAKSVKP